MSNIRYVKTRNRNLSSKLVQETLKEIVSRRFGPAATVVGDQDWFEVIFEHLGYGFLVCLKTRKTISSKSAIDSWLSYVQSIVLNELATKFEARCSDEGLPGESWEPGLEWYEDGYCGYSQRTAQDGRPNNRHDHEECLFFLESLPDNLKHTMGCVTINLEAEQST